MVASCKSVCGTVEKANGWDSTMLPKESIALEHVPLAETEEKSCLQFRNLQVGLLARLMCS